MNIFYITERDVNVLKFLHENKIAQRDQLHNLFFKKTNIRVFNRRILKLLEHGYVERRALALNHKLTSCYQLSPKGFQYLKSFNEFEEVFKSERSEAIEHDISLVVVRGIISAKKKVIKFFTENMLQCNSYFIESDIFKKFIRLQSDAVCEAKFSKANHLLAIEYESSIKSKKRYEDKISDYYNVDIQAVIYICESQRLLEKIMEIDKIVSKRKKVDSKLYFCLMNDLKKSSTEHTFFSSSERTISLD